MWRKGEGRGVGEGGVMVLVVTMIQINNQSFFIQTVQTRIEFPFRAANVTTVNSLFFLF